LECITPETTFNELGVESLDYMDWLLEAEEKLGVSIPDEEAERIMTVGEFLRVLRAGGAAWLPDCQLVLIREGGCFREYSWMAVKGGKPQVSPEMLGVDPGLYDRELDG
jgi:acyl carrier protein